jgi:hypothetical protein
MADDDGKAGLAMWNWDPTKTAIARFNGETGILPPPSQAPQSFFRAGRIR